MKNYTQAPLPFQGQKRRFKSPFDGATIKTVAGTASYNTSYEDIMIYKKP